jgi:hypothetical protein
MLTNISFYRVILLELKANLITRESLSKNWFDGFGYCLKREEIIKIFELNDNDIVFGTPDEMNISGLFLDDDFSSCLDIMKLYNEIYSIGDETDSSNINVLSTEEIIKKRKITKLVHVTREENIESIKLNGILPVDTLKSKNIDFSNNDPIRLDYCTNAVSLSIENPNGYLCDLFQKRNPNSKYMVLEIDPKILYVLKEKEEPVKRIYSNYNASSRFSKKSMDNFEIMYEKVIRRRAKLHNRVGKKDCEPTSSQAEILFFSDIPPKYILNIYEYKGE